MPLQGGEGLAGGRIVLAVEQDRPPGEADREQVAQVAIIAPRQPRLPAQVGTPGRPAIDREQHRLEVVGPHRRRQAEALQHPGLGVLAGRGQRPDRAAEPRQAHQDADAVIVGERVAPEGVQALLPLRLPVGLVLAEVGGAGLADLVRDCLPPRQARVARGIFVEHVDQQRQARQPAEPIGPACRHGLQRERQIRGRDPPTRPRRAQVVARRQDLDPGEHRHARGHLAQRATDAFPVRIDGDAAIERPGRCDRLAGRLAGGVDARLQRGAGRAPGRRVRSLRRGRGVVRGLARGLARGLEKKGIHGVLLTAGHSEVIIEGLSRVPGTGARGVAALQPAGHTRSAKRV